MRIDSLNKIVKQHNDSLESFMEDMPPFIKVYSDKSVVYLPETTGTGFTRNIFLEEGLSVRSMNFSLRADFEFLRLKRKDYQEKTFQLYYFLDSIDFHFTLNDENTLLSPATFSNILLLSNDLQIRGKFEKKQVVRVIVISFSVSWLEKNGFTKLDSCCQLLSKTNEHDKGILMMQFPDIADHQVASEISKIHVPGNEFAFPIKANCLKLIDKFFEAIEIRKSANLKESKAEYFIQMLKVEEKISACLNTNLPLIKELSKEFLMSESNLKKYFRIVYGKNIYEYYLDKKMDLARTMLLNQNDSISKIAYSLGYEKVASFSKAFVKKFGVLPSLLKNQQSSIL